MSWTKKDYELVANTIAKERGAGTWDCDAAEQRTLDRLTLRFAEAFEKDDNRKVTPTFKRARFLEACGF